MNYLFCTLIKLNVRDKVFIKCTLNLSFILHVRNTKRKKVLSNTERYKISLHKQQKYFN